MLVAHASDTRSPLRPSRTAVDRHRDDVGLPIGADGGQPGERLAGQVVDLRLCERHHTSRPMNASSRVCSSASLATATRGP